jgi:hypothetical protein
LGRLHSPPPRRGGKNTYFGGEGSILNHGKDSYQYIIGSIEQITTKILPHFDNYPLITNKYSDYLLFKESPPGPWPGGGVAPPGAKAINLISSEKHLSPKRGVSREAFIEKIVAIKGSFNIG